MSKIRTIPPHVIMGYALLVRDKITLTQMKSLKRKIEKLNPDMHVVLDVDLIYRAAEEYPTKFRVDLEGNEIVVYSKEKFTPIFLNVCYSYLFSSQKEFKQVKDILLAV
ncbi:MAG: hypothetical protein J5614_09985 [Paludibacteraceae bacterium]|nr:hypothetical protein [Paludibacteraceae bacterium]